MDPRVTPVRADLAAEALRGRVDRPAYAAPRAMTVTAPVLDLLAAPGDGALASQLLWGEAVEVFEIDADTGLAWVQNAADGYVGYVPAEGLAPPAAAPTHRVASLGAQGYRAPRLKSRPLATLPWAARVSVAERQGGYARVAPGVWVAEALLLALEAPADPAAEAARLAGVPYLWGGRSQAGIDCSALVQLAFAVAGHALPRDSDQQAACGQAVARTALDRGDLVFWRGHVGVMLDPAHLVHANAHHMAVVVEPLEEAEARIARGDTGPITALRRIAG